MTFLDPMAGLTAAAVVTPILLALYFLKLRRRPVRVSSTLLWRRAVHDLQVNAPFRMIKPSWLLLIQLLALAALLLAFARPAIDAPQGATDRLVILIDRSASMNATDAPGEASRTRLEQAKQAALELVDRLSRSGDAQGRAEAIVIAFAHEARALTHFTDNRATLARAIESIGPTDQGSDLHSALRLVRTLITQSGEGAGEREDTATVALLSDGSFRERDEPASLGAVGARLRFIQVGPPPSESPDNIGIVAAGAQRDYEDPALVRLFARVINTNREPRQVGVTLYAMDEPVAVKTVDVPAATDEGLGDAPVTFELRGGVALAEVIVPLRLVLTSNDALAADNEAHMTLAPPTPARVLAVGPESGGPPDPFLLRALEAAAGRAPTPVDFRSYEASASSPEAQRGYDLVVFDRSTPSAMPAAPSLSFAGGLPIAGLEVGSAEESLAPTMIVWWRRTNPLLRQVSLGAVEVYRPRKLTIPGELGEGPESDEEMGEIEEAPADLGTAVWEHRVLARGLDGPLMLELERSGRRRAIVAFSLPESNWERSVSFPIFIANALERLAQVGAGAQAKLFTTIDPITLRAAPGADEIVLRLGEVIERAVPIRADADGAISIGTVGRAGLYRVDGAAEGESPVAVNLFDETESGLATAEAVRIAGEDVQRGGVGQAAPKEIWPLFVLAAFVLLVVEWVLFALRSKV